MKTVTFILGFLLIGLVVIAQNPHCHAIKKNGDSCRSTFLLQSGFCRAHDTSNAIPRCGDSGGLNSHGEPCRQPVKAKGDRCRFHPKQAKA